MISPGKRWFLERSGSAGGVMSAAFSKVSLVCEGASPRSLCHGLGRRVNNLTKPFLCAWIPLVGSSPVWLVGALYLAAQHALWKALLMVGCGLLAGILDNVVRALLFKGRSKLHPLVSLVAIFGGIEMFGLLGIFLGPIVAAVLL